MYAKKDIVALVEDKIAEKNIFLVDITVSSTNKISVIIDNEAGISIDDCVDLSRFIESRLDREREDFELEVSSAGIESPFKVEKQFLKNIGNKVEVLKENGEKISGVLKKYTNKSIEVEHIKKIKIKGSEPISICFIIKLIR